jgi:hypothetical protein
VLQEAAQQCTRFVALAPVENKSKEKSLYAFNITPLRGLTRAQLTEQPANASEFPYMLLLGDMIIK